MTFREVQLADIPNGKVLAQHFVVTDCDVASPEPGQVLVRVRHLGLNAGLAHRLGGEGTPYGPAIGVGGVPTSDAVVEILISSDERFARGDLAVGVVPWRTASVVDADVLRPIKAATEDDLAVHLTVLGHVGFTAWTGLVHIGKVAAGDIVCVSGAAGGVGSCVVQFAKARGASVIGIVGSDDKAATLTVELGADRAINRRRGAAVDLLRDAAPDGIDLYYDNVGGEQLEAALDVLNFGGRVVICGAVAGSRAPANYRRLIYQELSMRGFTVTAHEDMRAQFESEVSGWLEKGMVRSLHTVFDGIESVPRAFESLLSGASTGRVTVSLAT